jgi:DNA-binding CsgD family transcriptional regulator
MAEALLERDDELSRLEQLVSATVAGRGGLVYVKGPAGIGKSQLIAALLELAGRSGLRVLSARGGELERDFGTGVVRQLFEQLVAGAPAEQRRVWFAGAAALAGPLFDATDGVRAGRADEQAVLHGLYWLSTNLALERPLLVAVDDAHWADPPSMRFIAYLARRTAGSPILVAVAARPAETDADRRLLATIAADATAVLTPAPLSERGVRALLPVADAAAEFTAACHEVTGGNPFLLRELIVAIRAEEVAYDRRGAERVRSLGPPSVSAAVQQRLDRLPEGAGRLARAVAVLGTGAPLRHAAALAGIGVEEAARYADALAEAHILAPARPLDFVHPIVRRVVHDLIPVGELGLAHRAAATLLHEDGSDPESIAPHLLATDPAGDSAVVDGLRAAAARSLRNGAPDAAASYLRRALAEPPPPHVRPALLRDLGRAEISATQPAGIDHLQQALDATTDRLLRAAIARELALGLIAPGRYAEAIDALRLAVEEAGDADPELALQLTAELTTAAHMLPHTRHIAAQQASRIPRDLRGDTRAQRVALASLAMQTLLDGGPVAAVGEFAGRAVARGLIADLTTDYPIVFDALGSLWPSDAVDVADRAFTEALADARSRGSLLAYARVSCFRAFFRHRLGALDDSEADARASLDAAGDSGWPITKMASAIMIDVLVERGRLDEAERLLETAGFGAEIPYTFMLDFLLAARGGLRLAQGRTAEGVDDLTELGRRERAAWPGRCPALFPSGAQAAVGLLALGRRDEARRLADAEVAAARSWGGAWSLGIALRAAGLVAGDAGTALLSEAVEVLAPSVFRLEYARAVTDLGAALRRAGRRTDARQPLGRGLDEASRCGATALAERARGELVAAGARPRRERRGGVAGLTPSELRVARMAARGMTNAQIAQALFVTPRNVELHLTHVYQKLGVATRGDLRDAVAAEDRQRERASVAPGEILRSGP